MSGIFWKGQAQNNANAPVYVAYTYIKTLPGKFNTYDSLLKNYSKKINEDQIKDGNYFRWTSYEVLMPSGSQADYNVVTVTAGTNIDMLLDPSMSVKDLFDKSFPQINEVERQKIGKSFSESRTIVKREIYTVLGSTSDNGAPTKSPTKYVVIDFMTPVEGKEEQYVKMETETFRPIHKQRIALGSLAGWAFLAKVLPSDSNDPTPFVTANFYDNFAGMMDGKYVEAVKKSNPTMDVNKLFQSVNTVKKGQRSEVWKLMVADDMQGK